MYPAMYRNILNKYVLNLLFLVKREILKCLLIIHQRATCIIMSFGKTKQNKKERHFYG